MALGEGLPDEKTILDARFSVAPRARAVPPFVAALPVLLERSGLDADEQCWHGG